MGFSLKSSLRQGRPEIQIPMGLVTEILTRLPTKSLMRFNCVSKLWSSLIRSQYFTNRFHKVPSQRLYTCISDGNNNQSYIVILSSAPHATTTPSTSYVVKHDLTIPCMKFNIIQNLGGFMCECNPSSRMPRIYNPATRQRVTIPTMYSNSPKVFRSYYFGHDPVNNQYKVLCSTGDYRAEREHWVLVLKPGASWKKAAPAPASLGFDPDAKPGLCINGVIYYMGLTDTFDKVVVSFDIGSEEFETIQMPQWIQTNLIEYGGKLTVFDHYHLKGKGSVDLWVLEDVGNKEWSRKTLVLQPSQLHLVSDTGFKVKGTTQTQSGKVLLIPKYFCYPLHILCYDLKSNDMRKIDIKGIPEHCFSDESYQFVDLMFMDQSESILYLET